MLVKKDKNISVRFTEEQYNKLKKLSDIEKVSISEYIRQIIKEIKVEDEK